MKNLHHIHTSMFIGAFWVLSCFAADWPTFRGNIARTGFYPEPVGIPGAGPQWMVSLGGEIISSPVVVDNMLYIGARDSCIYAIDGGTGRVQWKRMTGGWVDATPAVEGNTIIAGSRDSTIYQLNKSTGDVKKWMRAGVQLSSPAVTAAGMILSGLGILDHGLYAWDALKISFANDPVDPQWSIPLAQFAYSTPAVTGQMAVIGSTDGRLYGVDLARKDTVWSMQTKGLVYLSTPAIDQTTVYFAPGDEDRNIYAVNVLTGKIIWDCAPVSTADYAVRTLAKKQSVQPMMGALHHKLLHMSPPLRKKTIEQLRAGGVELPRVAVSKGLAKRLGGAETVFVPMGGMKTSSVAVNHAIVCVIQKELGYILTNDSLMEFKQQYTLYALDKKTGVQKWSFTDWCQGPLLGYCSSPVMTKDKVYFGWGEGRMYGLSAADGKVFWQDSLRGDIISSPAIAAGNLYVATKSGNLYKYNLSNTDPGLDFRTSTYCYPNPARGEYSTIQVYVKKTGKLSMTIYTLAEQPVLTVHQELKIDEKFSYAWKLRTIANGVYFAVVKVTYSDGSTDRKVLKIAVLK